MVFTSATMKVNRAITGSTIVNTKCYAVCVIRLSTALGSLDASDIADATFYFGPGQTITIDGNHELVSGVEFINT
jgi:hypothetical protein